MPDIVKWDIGVDGPIAPTDPIPNMPQMSKGDIVVIGGRGPVWRYGMAFHIAHGSAASVVCTYDPRIGAVVVASHHPDYVDGDVIDMDW
jgi:CRISPR-associated protein Csx3